MKNSTQWLKIFQVLDENKKRWLAAEKACEIGRGGISYISELTGMSRTTITKGIRELKEFKTLPDEMIRHSGGGRKSLVENDKKIIKAIENIVDENTAGDPMKILKWTSKTSRNIASELSKKGMAVSHTTICKILNDLDYSLQLNRKILNTTKDPNRDEQFKYINNIVAKFFKKKYPVISVDTKKKELIGNFKNNGQTWKKKISQLLFMIMTLNHYQMVLLFHMEHTI